MGGVKAGIPPGSVGEAYWNLHVPGVILVHLLGGVFLRFAARFRVLKRKRSGEWVTLLLQRK